MSGCLDGRSTVHLREQILTIITWMKVSLPNGRGPYQARLLSGTGCSGSGARRRGADSGGLSSRDGISGLQLALIIVVVQPVGVVRVTHRLPLVRAKYMYQLPIRQITCNSGAVKPRQEQRAGPPSAAGTPRTGLSGGVLSTRMNRGRVAGLGTRTWAGAARAVDRNTQRTEGVGVLPRAGDVLRVTKEASVQFLEPMLFRVIRVHDWPTYDGWALARRIPAQRRRRRGRATVDLRPAPGTPAGRHRAGRGHARPGRGRLSSPFPVPGRVPGRAVQRPGEVFSAGAFDGCADGVAASAAT